MASRDSVEVDITLSNVSDQNNKEVFQKMI